MVFEVPSMRYVYEKATVQITERDFSVRRVRLPLVKTLPRVNASRFQLEANCMHVVKLKCVAMQPQ